MSDQALMSSCLHLATSNPPGVYPVSIEGDKYWLKTCGEDKNSYIRQLSAKLAKIPGVKFFSTNAVMSPQHRLSSEVQVMKLLTAKGLPAPTLINSSSHYYLTKDAGRTLNSVPQEQLPESLIEEVFTLFGQLHCEKIVHGRPAMRDILLAQDGSLSLIDFEESIVGDCEQLMARDIFLLLMDLCRLTSVSDSEKIAGLEYWRALVPSEAWLELKRLGRVLDRLRFVAKAILVFKDNRTSKQILSTLDVIRSA